MESEARRPRPAAVVAVLAVAGALLCAAFAALGAWQVERLGWKNALVARVERGLQAAPVPAPGPSEWRALTREDDYRRVTVQGRADYAREVLVRASTELGGGFWVLTPLRTDGGWWVLVNRGFVPPALRTQVPRGGEVLAVPGLLRSTEPGGGFLQDNDPAAGRWYSRDVAAIAAAQGLEGPVAPFFVDAQAGADPAAWPRGGLTVVQFRNHHLGYALTWFALAALVAFAIGYLLWDHRRLRRAGRKANLADPGP